MRLIPVIDVRGGVAVHAVAGERSHYRPLRSVLTASTAPVAVAADLHRVLRNRELYVADLDAIEAAGSGDLAGLSAATAELVCWAAAVGVTLLVDAGVTTAAEALRLAAAGPLRVVVGTETLRRLTALGEIVMAMNTLPDAPPALASLDLRDGSLLSQAPALAGLTALEASAKLIGEGIGELIVLDLARVGRQAGVAAEQIAALHAAYPDVALLIGGGVRTTHDVEGLASVGAAGALIATAVHSGAISPEEWLHYAGQPG